MWLEFPSHEIDPSLCAVISRNCSFLNCHSYISLQRQVLITFCLNYYLGIPLWDLVSSPSSLRFLSDWSALNTGCLLGSAFSLEVKIPPSLLIEYLHCFLELASSCSGTSPLPEWGATPPTHSLFLDFHFSGFTAKTHLHLRSIRSHFLFHFTHYQYYAFLPFI